MATRAPYRTSPSFFKQGPTAWFRLMVAASLSLTLMVADQRWDFATPVRKGVATVLYPLQWLLLQPAQWADSLSNDLDALREAQAMVQKLTQENLELNRANQNAEYLALENAQLRELLNLQVRVPTRSRATQVLYRVADPYSYSVMISHGTSSGVRRGDAVIDANGVWGQVTQAYPFSAEVRLINSPQQNTPVINARSGAAGVVVGSALQKDALELQFAPTRADLQVGDLLVTSGLDAVYPPGFPVATITRIERGAKNYFDLILAQPTADVQSSRYLLVVHAELGKGPEPSTPPSPDPSEGNRPLPRPKS